MKLSNKILVGTIGFVFIYLSAALTEIRFRGNLNYLDDDMGITETVPFDGITVLSIQDLHESVVVASDENPRLEVRSISGNRISNLVYQQVGDTLIIQEFNLPDNEHAHLTIYVSEDQFKRLEAVEARVTIRDFHKNAFELQQTAGHIRFAEGNSIKVLHASVTGDGSFNFQGGMLDTLSVQLDNSTARINSGAVHVNGNMSDSYLWVSNIHHIDLKKDNTSRLLIN